MVPVHFSSGPGSSTGLGRASYRRAWSSPNYPGPASASFLVTPSRLDEYVELGCGRPMSHAEFFTH